MNKWKANKSEKWINTNIIHNENNSLQVQFDF